MKEASIATIALDMAQGLHYMHSLNMLHRDIKPANILIDGRVRPKAVHVDSYGDTVGDISEEPILKEFQSKKQKHSHC